MSQDSWDKLYEDAAGCTACELCKTRTNCVFGVGNRNADVLFIGEAPGENEDKTGVPFVGRAGQLLDKFLFAVDIPRERVYIANILKCRPPKNRDPLPAEEDACIDFLRRQVALIQPKVIVCLGRISAMRLILCGKKPWATLSQSVTRYLKIKVSIISSRKTFCIPER